MANIDLSGLTSKNEINSEEIVRQVIKEECDMFSGSDDDVGDIRSHPMKINLIEGLPVQLNYNFVLRRLYNELKGYIEDLLNK